MDATILEKLLNRSEGDTLDFKRDQYRYAGAPPEDKGELLKDILAFANTPRGEDAFILIGVEEVKGGPHRVVGVTLHLDDADLQQFVNSKTQRPVTFSYETCSLASQSLGVIRIPPQAGPLHLKKDFGRLKRNEVYIRRGSSTAVATPDEIAGLASGFIPPATPHHFGEVESYLPRKVCRTEDADSYRLFIDAEGFTFDLATVVERNRRVVLVCDAGTGKSTELRRLAALYSKPDSRFHVELVRLNRYVDQPITELLCPSWRQVPQNELLIGLDGLDEVEAKNRGDAVRRIESFADEHPEAHLVVSCRTNFYSTKTGKYPGTLRDFESYTLLKLDADDEEVKAFIVRKLGARRTAFSRTVGERGLSELLRLPFYLVRMVELFAETGSLPPNRAGVFEWLLQQRVEHDVLRAHARSDLREERQAVIRSLERLALGMETLGRNYISDDEFRALMPDKATREQIKQCTLFENSRREPSEWQFEHNNFQEFLAARALAAQPVETVKDFTSFGPDYRKVKPSWVNTLSLLFSSLEPGSRLLRDLSAWVEEIEPELFVKFEPDKIEAAKRNAIVKRVFAYYKERRIRIDADKYSYYELARFGEPEEIADFLLTEIEGGDEPVTVTDALNILGHSYLPRKLKRRALNLLVRCATNSDNKYVQNRSLLALAHLGLTSREVVEQVTTSLRSNEEDWVRYGLYYFLSESDSLDEYIDVFLDGIRHVRAVNRITDEGWYLREGLKRAKTAPALRQILTHYKYHSREWQHVFLEDVVPHIIDNTAKAFPTDRTLFGDVFGLLAHLIEDYREAAVRPVLAFFDKTGTRLEAFKLALALPRGDDAQYIRNRGSLLAALSDSGCLRYFVGQYSQGVLNDNDVWEFQRSLGYAGSGHLYQPFNDLINEASGGKFVIPPTPDYQAEDKRRWRENFQLFFDREALVRRLGEIFEGENKRVFTFDELGEVYTKAHIRRENTEYWRGGIFILRDMTGELGGSVSLEEAANLIERNWEDWSTGKIYEYLENDTDQELILTDEQKAVVERWCRERLPDVDFRTALAADLGGMSTTRRYARRLWFFRRRLNLRYPEDVLLDMLSFDGYARWVFNSHGQNAGQHVLAEELDEESATDRILENLELGIASDHVLRDHFEYCRRHRIPDVVPFALREIRDGRNSFAHRDALETVCDFPEARRNLEGILSEIRSDFRWEVVERLLKLGSEVCADFLRRVLAEGNEDDKLKAARYLVRLQDIDGLTYYADHIIGRRSYPSVFAEDSTLSRVETPAAVPALMKLLEASYQDCFVRDDVNRLNSDVLDALRRIAVKSAENYECVRSAVATFLSRNVESDEFIRYLHHYLDRLEKQYYITKSENISLADVLDKLAKVDLLPA
jgi:hypothetical protein